MKKLKKLWKNNKIAVLFVSVILIIIILLLIMILPLYSSRSGSVYGNRLDGIKDVAIKKDVNDKIKEIFKIDSIENVKFDLKGKIFNVIVNVKEGNNVTDLMSKCDDALKQLDEKQLKYYDIQFFLTNKDGENAKTIVGYKNKDSAGISWTNNK